MVRAVAIEKTGAVRNIEGCPGAAREVEIDAGAESIALVVIEEEVVVAVGGREVR